VKSARQLINRNRSGRRGVSLGFPFQEFLFHPAPGSLRCFGEAKESYCGLTSLGPRRNAVVNCTMPLKTPVFAIFEAKSLKGTTN
jgi:hypothetical protein